MAAAFLDAAQVLNTGFQELYGCPVTVEGVCSYPSVGRNAYTTKEAAWFNATYDYLESQLDDGERTQRLLPAKKRSKRAGAAAAASADAVQSALAAAAPPVEMEDDDDLSLCPRSSRKRGHKAR